MRTFRYVCFEQGYNGNPKKMEILAVGAYNKGIWRTAIRANRFNKFTLFDLSRTCSKKIDHSYLLPVCLTSKIEESL